MKKILIAGPWIGEFGWELMAWQAQVRAKRLSRNYAKTIVITFPGREIFYEGCEILTHDLPFSEAKVGFPIPDDAYINKWINVAIKKFELRIKDVDIFTPKSTQDFFYRIKRKIAPQNTLKYFDYSLNFKKSIKYDILFHFRKFEKEKSGELHQKSLDKDKCDELVKHYQNHGFQIGCIGAEGFAYCPPRALNLFSDNFSITIDHILSSRLVVGGSSGPMHLASLCKVPIVVWTGGGFTLDRYYKAWNPFRAPVIPVCEHTFNPPLDLILNAMDEALHSLGVDLALR
jgi:hypothetical protein